MDIHTSSPPPPPPPPPAWRSHVACAEEGRRRSAREVAGNTLVSGAESDPIKQSNEKEYVPNNPCK
uniref:Uncharacterized protein n=1 Tax=Oryza glumipatula TaxID=40148 RepID=A0A0D9YPT7_9ORYZ